MRTIDADPLRAQYLDGPDELVYKSSLVRSIDEAPTVSDNYDLIMRTVRAALCARKPQHIIVNPEGGVSVWPETPTAHWIKEPDRQNHWHCSNCGNVEGIVCQFQNFRYCPACGAAIIREEESDARS